MMTFFETLFFAIVVAATAFIIYTTGCAPPQPAVPGQEKISYVVCVDLLGEVVYDGEVKQAWIAGAETNVIELSGMRVEMNNVACIYTFGTRDQYRQFLDDHYPQPPEEDGGDDSF